MLTPRARRRGLSARRFDIELEDVMAPGSRGGVSRVSARKFVAAKSLLLLAATGSFGCSFAFVTGPPSEPPSDPREPVPECTTSMVVPMLDGFGAVISGALVVVHATSDEDAVAWYGEVEPETATVISAAQLAAFGAGAVYGFIQTSRCRSFLTEKERVQRPTWSPARATESRSSTPPEDEKPE